MTRIALLFTGTALSIATPALASEASLKSEIALLKAQREVTECRRFRELGEQLLEVNEKICELRPVTEATPSAQEKKRRKRSKQRLRAK